MRMSRSDRGPIVKKAREAREQGRGAGVVDHALQGYGGLDAARPLLAVARAAGKTALHFFFVKAVHSLLAYRLVRWRLGVLSVLGTNNKQ